MINKNLADIIEYEIKQLPLQDISFGALENSGQRDEKIKNLILEKTYKLDEVEKKRIIEEFLGIGPIEQILHDEDITEIIITGNKSIWIEKNGSLSKINDFFISEYTFSRFVDRICSESKMNYNLEYPMANGKFRDFRLHLVSSIITAGSPVMCLRRHPKSPWTLEKLLKKKWCTEDQLDKIKFLINGRKNFLVAGGTGSGKTSFLSACLSEMNDNERIVIIEDTSELFVPNHVSNKLLTRFDIQNVLPTIDQSELVKQSLRMRPDRLVVGEVRGGEAKDLLMALSTGHGGSFGSLHAETAAQALIRLEMLIQLGAPNWSLTAVRNLILLSLNFICIVEKSPEFGRRLQGIYQISSLEETGFLLEKIC